VQVKEHRRGSKLVSCFLDENRVVIHDLETGEQTEMSLVRPLRCATSTNLTAVATCGHGMHIFAEGDVDQVIPNSTSATCAAFHPRRPDILVIGFNGGPVGKWDIQTRTWLPSFKVHTDCITSIRFASDGRMLLSSFDKAASILTLDSSIQVKTLVKLEGHARVVWDILPLPFSSTCLTSSQDNTIKLWDVDTGACLRTLIEHTDQVRSLALHPSGLTFASGSQDNSVIIWSCDSVEVVHRVWLSEKIYSLVFGECNALYVGVSNHGVISCNALTGELGHTIISGKGSVFSQSICTFRLYSDRNI
jgi:WD40 repeat protein